MKQLIFLSALLVVLSLSSCIDKKEDVSVVGDAFILSRTAGDETVYGLSLHAYSLSKFSSVTVTSDDLYFSNYTLTPYQNDEAHFHYETPSAQFSTEIPGPGTYTFNASFKNGNTDVATDILTTAVLAPPVLERCEWSSGESALMVEWADVSSAELYVVRIFNGNNLVYLYQLSTEFTSLKIAQSSNGWLNNEIPQSGTGYKVLVQAFLFESATADAFNIQAISETDQTIVWGQE